MIFHYFVLAFINLCLFMKRIILLLFIMLGVAELYAQEGTQTVTGTQIKQWTGEFTSIDVDAPIKLKLIKCDEGQGPHIIYDTKGVYTSKFTAEVNKDKQLKIRERVDPKRESITEVEVYYHDLSDITIAKADVSVADIVDTELLDITLSNDTHFMAEIDVLDLIINITGKSRVTITGSALYQTADVSTAEYDASNLRTMSTVVSSSHSASVKVDAYQRLEAKTSTSGYIKYRSLPEILRIYTPMFGGEVSRLQ